MSHKSSIDTNHRIVRVSGVGTTQEVLSIQHEPIAQPRPGEVRIKVQAIGLNRAENLFHQGYYMYPPKAGAPIGYEAAGVVDALGDGVVELQVGDRVSTVPAFSMNDYGMYAEYAIAPAYAAIRYPEHLSAAEAASIWMQYLTVYGALIQTAKLQRGEVALFTAATGGLGVAAIQIAKDIGAISIATTRSASKAPFLRGLGADHVIVTSEEDVAARVLEITHGRGADVVYDAVGGAQFAKLIAATARFGRVITYGALAPDAVTGTPLPWFDLLARAISIRGHLVFELTCDPSRFGSERPFDPEWYPRAIEYTLDGLERGALKPSVAQVFSFDNILDAHDAVENNPLGGKVVVQV
jgi:NADPH:quinone reductase-like Zn-dependent oxidoreductase